MVSPIGSGGPGHAAQMLQVRSEAAERILKAADTNKDGKIAEAESSAQTATYG